MELNYLVLASETDFVRVGPAGWGRGGLAVVFLAINVPMSPEQP